MADPRAHRHARITKDDRITYSCGCANEIQDSGVLRSASKCDPHSRERRDPATLGREYFEGLGCIVDGIPQSKKYIDEMREALAVFTVPFRDKWMGYALEIGCGCSMYAPGILNEGFTYFGIEPSEWAARWTESTYDVCVFNAPFEDVEPEEQPSLILAAHSLEHMDDAPGAIRRCAEMLQPGGEFWVVVPNDDDPLNPDHIWTFSEPSLRRCVESAGFTVLNLESRRRIEREAFLYLRAIKP